MARAWEELKAVIAAVRLGSDGRLRSDQVRRLLEFFEAQPPSRRREQALAWLFLAEAELRRRRGRAREALGPASTAYAYARAARDGEAFARAREAIAALRSEANGRPRSRGR